MRPGLVCIAKDKRSLLIHIQSLFVKNLTIINPVIFSFIMNTV